MLNYAYFVHKYMHKYVEKETGRQDMGIYCYEVV